MHSGICKNFAANGYIVFALDHHDGTCSYYEHENENQGIFQSLINMLGYYQNFDLFHMEYRKNQIDIRRKEVMAFIDELE